LFSDSFFTMQTDVSAPCAIQYAYDTVTHQQKKRADSPIRSDFLFSTMVTEKVVGLGRTFQMPNQPSKGFFTFPSTPLCMLFCMTTKYARSASTDVKKAMHEYKRGKLKSGRSGKRVQSRSQAVAIGLSEARRKGKKVPRKGRQYAA
jgi:hypothetical protein